MSRSHGPSRPGQAVEAMSRSLSLTRARAFFSQGSRNQILFVVVSTVAVSCSFFASLGWSLLVRLPLNVAFFCWHPRSQNSLSSSSSSTAAVVTERSLWLCPACDRILSPSSFFPPRVYVCPIASSLRLDCVAVTAQSGGCRRTRCPIDRCGRQRQGEGRGDGLDARAAAGSNNKPLGRSDSLPAPNDRAPRDGHRPKREATLANTSGGGGG
jgi:hypothetical protein